MILILSFGYKGHQLHQYRKNGKRKKKLQINVIYLERRKICVIIL